MNVLEVRLSHSLWLGLFVGFVHLLAVIAMAISDVDLLLKVSVGLAILCAGIASLCDLQAGPYYRRLRCEYGQWHVDCGTGFRPVSLRSPVVVWHWFAVLRFTGECRVAAIVLPDMLSSDAFRRLRVLLRLGYGFPPREHEPSGQAQQPAQERMQQPVPDL